jgi:hypothetical protein
MHLLSNKKTTRESSFGLGITNALRFVVSFRSIANTCGAQINYLHPAQLGHQQLIIFLVRERGFIVINLLLDYHQYMQVSNIGAVLFRNRIEYVHVNYSFFNFTKPKISKTMKQRRRK